MIDLRSDTVTKPTDGMLEAMSGAEVGDDVFGEDPSANAFQKKMAEMFGMEAGLFVPSGVMSNQLALKVLTNPGEEVIIEQTGHVFNYETSAASLISSVQIHPVPGHRGKLTPELIRSAMRMGKDWEPLPSLIVIENTTNKGGGACYTKQEMQEIRMEASAQNLAVHLDGARIWNAMVATGIDPVFFGSTADTMTISFSKGLGAPVGSMLLSSKQNIDKARRFRKMLGGGMRQIGILAVAADYAVEQHLPLLENDHRRAKELARTVSKCRQLAVDLDSVETNILIFEVLEGTAGEVVNLLKEYDIYVVPFGGKTVRCTLHYGIDDEDIEKVSKVLQEEFG